MGEGEGARNDWSSQAVCDICTVLSIAAHCYIRLAVPFPHLYHYGAKDAILYGERAGVVSINEGTCPCVNLQEYFPM